jgi:Zn-dependent peptidase ImmA (M78 family)/transcriptional regulator with XRE-family HTH domain
MNTFYPDRLTVIRESRGLSRSQVGEELGLSRQTVSNWESGIAKPIKENVFQLAMLLQVPVDYFYTEPYKHININSSVFFRNRASTLVSQRRMATSRIVWLGELVDRLSHFVEIPKVRIKPISGMWPGYSNAEIEEIATNARRSMSIKGDGPIDNTIRLCESSGIVVSRFAIANTLDAFSLWMKISGKDLPFILVDMLTDSPGRIRYNTAHELGHLILHRNIKDEEITTSVHRALEKEANSFASAFLMPKKLFTERARYHGVKFHDLIKLKKEWRVSIQAIVMRLADLNLISPETRILYFKRISSSGYRLKEPGDEFIPFEDHSLFKKAFVVMQENGIDPDKEVGEKMRISLTDLNELLGVKKVSDDYYFESERPSLSIDNIVQFNRRKG